MQSYIFEVLFPYKLHELIKIYLYIFDLLSWYTYSRTLDISTTVDSLLYLNPYYNTSKII